MDGCTKEIMGTYAALSIGVGAEVVASPIVEVASIRGNSSALEVCAKIAYCAGMVGIGCGAYLNGHGRLGTSLNTIEDLLAGAGAGLAIGAAYRLVRRAHFPNRGGPLFFGPDPNVIPGISFWSGALYALAGKLLAS